MLKCLNLQVGKPIKILITRFQDLRKNKDTFQDVRKKLCMASYNYENGLKDNSG